MDFKYIEDPVVQVVAIIAMVAIAAIGAYKYKHRNNGKATMATISDLQKVREQFHSDAISIRETLTEQLAEHRKELVAEHKETRTKGSEEHKELRTALENYRQECVDGHKETRNDIRTAFDKLDAHKGDSSKEFKDVREDIAEIGKNVAVLMEERK